MRKEDKKIAWKKARTMSIYVTLVSQQRKTNIQTLFGRNTFCDMNMNTSTVDGI